LKLRLNFRAVGNCIARTENDDIACLKTAHNFCHSSQVSSQNNLTEVSNIVPIHDDSLRTRQTNNQAVRRQKHQSLSDVAWKIKAHRRIHAGKYAAVVL